MDPLATQEQFEILIGKNTEPVKEPVPSLVIVYFTAKWCGACRRLNLPMIVGSTSPDVKWLKCDIDENDYTAGYCGITSIPTFLAIHEKKILGTMKSSDTATVVEWIKSFPQLFDGKKI
jgi:thioredoxin-like negative regulator of GroEL